MKGYTNTYILDSFDLVTITEYSPVKGDMYGYKEIEVRIKGILVDSSTRCSSVSDSFIVESFSL